MSKEIEIANIAVTNENHLHLWFNSRLHFIAGSKTNCRAK